ncbi:MAG TPA: GNAT family N-acetyltransferase [Phycisphaerae bacterium]|nr:GNAT family N-acetyltransferase [Phycisphaerae bacterium]
MSDAAIQGSAGEAVPRLVRIPAEKPGAAVAFLQARSRGVMDLIAHFWERLAATPPLQRQDLHLLLAADTSGSVDMQMSTEINALRGAMLYVPKAHRADVLALDARAAQAFAAYIVHRGADAAGGGAGSNGGAEPAKRGNGSAEATSPPVAPTQGTALPTAATHPAVGTAPEIQLLDYSTGGPPGGGAATGIAAINGTPLPPSQRVAIDFITGGAEGIEWLVPVLLPAVHRRAPARQMVNMVMQLPAEAACEAAPEVRAAREADVPVLNRWRRAYREERGILFDADLDAWVATGRVFVSEAGGQVVAVAKLDVELPELVEIGGVYTFPDHRQRGYGSRLVADLACRIRAMKKVPTLQVDVENGPALRLYEAAGWVRRGRLARVWLTG